MGVDLARSLDLFRSMCMIRGAERLIVRRYGEDEMRTPMHMSMGQEAVSAALCAALGASGRVYGTYRSHALFLAKTRDPFRFFGELYGRVAGPSRGKAGSMHLAAPEMGLLCSSAIVGATISSAVGTAFAEMRLGTGRPCAALFGDGAVEEGEFWESLNAACVMRIPVLLVCEDNGFAVHSPRSARHGFDRIADVVRGFRCIVREDVATDAESLLCTFTSAIADAREERGPAFVHVLTHRHLDHIGVEEGPEAGRGSAEEHAWWLERDPLALQRRRLIDLGMAEAEVAREESLMDAMLATAAEVARAEPQPAPEELHAGVFHEAD